MALEYPIYKPWITELELEYATDAIKSGWISSKGKYIDELESEFAEFVGTKYALTVCNGTAACHLAMLSLGIGVGDEVIVPNLTFVATANAVSYVGATPVFADPNIHTWNCGYREIKERITKNTKAVFAVHLFGNPIDYWDLQHLRQQGILVAEDACESIGSFFRTGFNTTKMTGNFGDVGVFSLYANKSLCSGEGGLLVTNNKSIYEKAKLLRGQGQTHQYFHPVIGYNYRMTNVAAAIGLAQLRRRSEILAEKRRVYDRYNERLGNYGQKVLDGHYHGGWMIGIKCPRKLDWIGETGIKNTLAAFGIETRPMFWPMTSLPPYRKDYENSPNKWGYFIDDRKRYPHSYHLFETVVILPSYPQLSNNDIDFICDKVLSVIENKERVCRAK